MASPLFRPKDIERLNKLHPLLKRVVLRCASNGHAFIVDTTERGLKAQEAAKKTGHSNAHFGQSPHNYTPALGVDLYPSTFPKSKMDEYNELALAMFAAARQESVSIDWGGDWHSLKDYPHYELSDWKLLAKKEHLAK